MTKKLGELWLERAEEDLRSARVLLDAGLFNMVCFHCQQTAEKSLKGLLASLNQPIPRIHNLIRLRSLCEDALGISVGVDEEGLIFLNDVYLDSRYPVDLGILPFGLPTRADAKRACDYAAELYNVFSSIISKRRSAEEPQQEQ